MWWPYLRGRFAPVAWFLAIGLLVMSARTIGAQQDGGTLAGRVLSDAQRPVQGAQIGARSADGTVRGTVADGNGRFRITGLSGGEVRLEVRMLGFRSYTGTARVGDTTVAITLASTAIALDQVVITGTPGGTQARAIGNEVAHVDASNVVRAAPVLSVQQLLGARVPGVVVLPGSGNVGTGSVTRVRGNASLSLSNDPLIYIDGVRVNGAADAGPNIRQGRQVSRLNDLRPEEIESIEVIKGPAAATLYGTEASNGVIQIITKKGAAGTTSFDFTARAGGTWLMNAEGKVPTVYSKDVNGQVVGVNLLKREREQGRPVFRTGPLQGVSGSLRGGTAQARYFLSGEVDRDEGIVTYNWLRKKNVRANVQLLPLPNLDVTSSAGFVRSNTRFAQAAAGWGVWDQLIWGSPSRLTTPTRGMLRATPQAAGEIESLSDIDRFTGSVQASHTPWPWFKHRVTFGTDITNDLNSIRFPRNPLGSSYFFGALSLGQKTEERIRSMFTTLDYAVTATVELPRALSAQTSAGVQSYLK